MRVHILGVLLALVLTHRADAATDTPNLTRVQADNSYIVTFKPSSPSGRSPILPPQAGRSAGSPPFAEHSTGQRKEALAATLGIRGQVASIFESINAAHLLIDAGEAERLRQHPMVLRVDPDEISSTAQTVQTNPGWALDRLDQTTTALNSQHVYNANGAGRTIWILDTGLNLGYPKVAAEFGGRASVFWDVNGAGGLDCHGHGTQVASAAAGSTRGIAKGATVIAVKITVGCTKDSYASTWVAVFNWLAVNAPRGTIVNLSSAFSNGPNVCGGTVIVPAVEDAIRAAHSAGIIVVVAAGNDSCDAANYTPTRMPEAFVVGATDSSRLAFGQDSRASYSRYGSNVSVFAPGTNVSLIHFYGDAWINSGTSFAAPYQAGIFAVACQAAGSFCDTVANAGVAYQGLRSIANTGTVVEANGSVLPGNTTSRFISRYPW